MTHIPTPPPNAWTWTSDGWTRFTPDGRRLEHGGNGLEPVEPVPVLTVGGGGDGLTLGAVTDPKPADRAPVAAWRRFFLRLLRRGYPR